MSAPPLPNAAPPDRRSSAAPCGMAWCAWIAVAAAIGLRLWMWQAHPPKTLLMDEALYLRTAEWFYDTGEIDTVSRAPGYPVFIAAMFALLPLDLLGSAIAAQIALAGLCVYMLYVLGRRAFGPAAGLVAAWFFALDPTLAAYSLFAFVEPFYIFLILLCTLAFLRARQRGTVWDYLIAGLLFGAATLTRGQTLLLAPFLAAWACLSGTSGIPARRAVSQTDDSTRMSSENAPSLALRAGMAKSDIGTRQSAIRLAVVFSAAWAVIVLPWSFRNLQKHGVFILVDTTAARTLWHANHIPFRISYSWPFFRYLQTPGHEPMPSEENDSAAVHGQILRDELRWMRDRPGLVLGRIPEKLAALLNPTSFFQRHLNQNEMANWQTAPGRNGGIGPAEKWSYATTLCYALVLFPAVFGLLHGRRDNALWWMCLLQIAVTLVIHAFFVSQSRYRLPMMPFLMLLAGAAWADPRRYFAVRNPRTWFAAVLVAVLIWSWMPYWGLVTLHP